MIIHEGIFLVINEKGKLYEKALSYINTECHVINIKTRYWSEGSNSWFSLTRPLPESTINNI
jgi:hypothetical protein